jgi:hypothetical protein
MRQIDENLALGGPFRLDAVRKLANGVSTFDLKMAICINGGSCFGGYVTIKTGARGIGLFLTKAHDRDGIRLPLIEDCIISPDSSIQEAAWLFSRAMLDASFSPKYDQQNRIVEALEQSDFSKLGG